MITYYKNQAYTIKNVGGASSTDYLIEIACKSTDTKPTDNIVSGSLALEVDTGKVFAFDGENWNELA